MNAIIIMRAAGVVASPKPSSTKIVAEKQQRVFVGGRKTKPPLLLSSRANNGGTRVGAAAVWKGKRGRGQLQVVDAGSTSGRFFRVTTFGESHGGGVGCVVDGVPPKLQISREDLQFELDRRRPGQSRITTPRNEEDSCEILSGVGLDGVTLGTPIAVLVRNKDHKSQELRRDRGGL